MWVEIVPRRMDFCGRPPCAHCYYWRDGPDAEPQSGLSRMALDLLGKEMSELSPDQVKQLREASERLHRGKLEDGAVLPEDPTPPGPVDIGMGPTKWLSAFLRQQPRPQAAPLAANRLTCDHVADRTAAREAEEAAKKKLRDKRREELREFAEAFKEAKGPSDEAITRPRDMTQGDVGRRLERSWRTIRAEVPLDFIRYCENRGITDPNEIYAHAERERMVRYSQPPPEFSLERNKWMI